jgi:hypothetical protein
MESKAGAVAYLLGVVAILAGLAALAFSSIRIIDILGGAVLVVGMGAVGWATGGRRRLRWFTGVLLATALFCAVLALLRS